MLTYFYTATLVSGYITYNFFQDEAAPKADLRAWLFIAFAAVIWPITLPNMVRKVMFSRPGSLQTSIHASQRVEL